MQQDMKTPPELGQQSPARAEQLPSIRLDKLAKWAEARAGLEGWAVAEVVADLPLEEARLAGR